VAGMARIVDRRSGWSCSGPGSSLRLRSGLSRGVGCGPGRWVGVRRFGAAEEWHGPSRRIDLVRLVAAGRAGLSRSVAAGSCVSAWLVAARSNGQCRRSDWDLCVLAWWVAKDWWGSARRSGHGLELKGTSRRRGSERHVAKDGLEQGRARRSGRRRFGVSRWRGEHWRGPSRRQGVVRAGMRGHVASAKCVRARRIDVAGIGAECRIGLGASGLVARAWPVATPSLSSRPRARSRCSCPC
jgi:hypothetical protein